MASLGPAAAVRVEWDGGWESVFVIVKVKGFLSFGMELIIEPTS